MSLDDYKASLAPKVRGTWNLHEKLSKEDLDFFIMLSSTAGIIGNASQAAYSAASTFLDAFADYRNNLGLPAVTIDLGMVSDVGYLAVNADLRHMLEKLGFSSVYLPELLAMIKTAIVHPLRSKSSSGRSVTGLGTYKLDGSRPGLEYSIFAHFRRMALKMKQTSRESDGSLAVVRDVLQQTTSVDEAAEAVCTVLMAKISVLLMIPLEDIKASRSMSEYGMDSLVAVEMRNWLFREMDATVPILELLANESLLQLSAKIVKRSKLANPAILGEGVETGQ
jgi:hypothetical protein